MLGLDHFGAIARFYDHIGSFNDRQRMAENCALPADGILMDLGGGTGRVAYGLKDLCQKSIVVDLSPGMLRQARLKPGIETVCAASERLPFAANRFERVIMIDAFHHVAVQKETLSEMWRSLKPGGRLVIQEPDIRRLSVKFLALAEKVLLMRSHFVEAGKIVVMLRELMGLSEDTARIQIKPSDYSVWIIVDKKG